MDFPLLKEFMEKASPMFLLPLSHPDVQKHVLDDNTIVYYQVRPPHDEKDDERLKKIGFDFVAFEWSGNPAEAEQWGPETYVEVFAYGIAYFDGIRHLYFGHEKTKNEGYHYYPHLDSLINLASWLQEMEEKHCWDAPEKEDDLGFDAPASLAGLTSGPPEQSEKETK